MYLEFHSVHQCQRKCSCTILEYIGLILSCQWYHQKCKRNSVRVEMKTRDRTSVPSLIVPQHHHTVSVTL